MAKSNGHNITVIIPAAGIGRRMKSHGSKSLIQLATQETLLDRQITVIRKQYPKAEIIVVVGFQADKIIKDLIGKPDIKVVENELYEETNVVRSIGMALRVASNSNILIIYGDIIFNPATLIGLPLHHSATIVDNKNNFEPDVVGVNIIDGYVGCFSYGLRTKWAQIVYLTGKELSIFKTIACNKDKRKLNTFEILNKVIELDGKIKAIEPQDMKIIEINSTQDKEKAKKVDII